jgi:hypothetical protein
MVVSERQRSSEPPSASTGTARERRDIRRAFSLWRQNVPANARVPLLEQFDFSAMTGDWGHRFLVCSDEAVENAAFVAYGLEFAELLGLPQSVTAIIPLNRQIPERYHPLFDEGCRNAMDKQAPARFSGAFEHDIKAELFRAVFLPIRLQPSWSKWLIFGSFNCRTVLSVDNKAL